MFFFKICFVSRGVSVLRTSDLVDLTKKGIPLKYRGDVWMIYSGALDLLVILMFLNMFYTLQTFIDFILLNAHTPHYTCTHTAFKSSSVSETCC